MWIFFFFLLLLVLFYWRPEMDSFVFIALWKTNCVFCKVLCFLSSVVTLCLFPLLHCEVLSPLEPEETCLFSVLLSLSSLLLLLFLIYWMWNVYLSVLEAVADEFFRKHFSRGIWIPLYKLQLKVQQHFLLCVTEMQRTAGSLASDGSKKISSSALWWAHLWLLF